MHHTISGSCASRCDVIACCLWQLTFVFCRHPLPRRARFLSWPCSRRDKPETMLWPTVPYPDTTQLALQPRCPSCNKQSMVFFFICVHSYISGVHNFCGDFYVCDRFFNPTMEVVIIPFRGWCMLDVYLLLAFTCPGHECQDFLRLCDVMHVCTDKTSVYTLIQKSFRETEIETMLTPRGKSLLHEAQRRF